MVHADFCTVYAFAIYLDYFVASYGLVCRPRTIVLAVLHGEFAGLRDFDSDLCRDANGDNSVLDSSSVNVFGSFPSYHNTWAALAVFFGVVALREHRSVLGVICVVFGLLITLSTFLLHQHAVLDAVFTYALVGLCWWLDAKLGWSRKLLQAKK